MKNSNFFCKIISELRAFVPGLFPGYCAQKIFSGIYRTLTGHQIKNILSYVLFIFDALQLSFYVYWAKMILNGCLPFTLFLRPTFKSSIQKIFFTQILHPTGVLVKRLSLTVSYLLGGNI